LAQRVRGRGVHASYQIVAALRPDAEGSCILTHVPRPPEFGPQLAGLTRVEPEPEPEPEPKPASKTQAKPSLEPPPPLPPPPSAAQNPATTKVCFPVTPVP
jgi:hypothetical protein